jgi:creatinine amidohydrolase/Fe(II)-dependent formamide hydrolase-like protein
MLRVAAAALLLSVSFASAAAPNPPTLFMSELTWTEVRDAVKAGKTTVILPVGGTEQSGPHIAIGKHNYRVRFLAARIAASLGDTLVAPVLPYCPEGSINPPTEHMRFPGTISIPESTFEEVVLSMGRSLRRAGFKHVVLIGDHGGYQKSLKKVAATLNKEWAGSGVRAYYIEEYYTASSSEYGKLLEGRGFSQDDIGTHAGLADTSLTMAIDPSLVRTDRLRGPMGKEDGVTGDPALSSTDLGKLGIDLVVKRTVEAIRTARSGP